MKYSNQIKSIAIGSFDGMHLAHQALIARAEAVAVIERGGGYLTPGYKRTMFTDRPCYFYLFEKIRDLTPEDFVGLLQEDFPSLEKIVVGYDFAFGRGKAADASMLRRLFEGEVEIVYTGLRPGEKLYEELLINDAECKTRYESIYVAGRSDYPIEKLREDIRRLLEAHDKRAMLKAIVPEYTPS